MAYDALATMVGKMIGGGWGNFRDVCVGRAVGMGHVMPFPGKVPITLIAVAHFK